MVSARWGVGTQSCTVLLSSPDKEIISSWIWGYWSGLNTMNLKNHFVGDKLKGGAIVDAVRRECGRTPSTPIASAIEAVYVDMATAPR
jgi:hypothetical protein